VKGHLAARVPGAEPLYQQAEPGAADADRAPQPQLAFDVPRAVAGLGQRGLHFRVGGAEAIDKLLAERRKGYLAAGPLEQGAAYPSLQGCDQPAHPRLGQMKPLRRAREMQFFGEG
jgi:hypothetical protein